MESYAFKPIDLKQISSDHLFCVRCSVDGDALKKSIERIGVFTPIMVTSKKPYLVISGHKRLAAARQLGLKRIEAFIFKKKFDLHQLYEIAILSNPPSTWSDYDRAFSIGKAVDKIKIERSVMVSDILPHMGIPASLHLFDQYYKISKLQTDLFHTLATHQMPYWVAYEFTMLPKDDQKVFVQKILSKISLTASQWRDVCIWLRDMMASSGMSLPDLLEKHDFVNASDNPLLDKKQRSELFFNVIRKLRFPRLSEYESKFESISDQFQSGRGQLKLEAPNYFEDEGFLIKIKANNSESLEQSLNLLKEKRGLLNSLFDIML